MRLLSVCALVCLAGGARKSVVSNGTWKKQRRNWVWVCNSVMLID